MAFQYASYAVPQAPQSSLADLMPQYLAGQQRKYDQQAYEALANIGQNGPAQPQSLSTLDPMTTGSLPAPNAGPASSPASSPAIDPNGHPATVGNRANDLQAYLGNVAKAESNGDPNAVNPTTGATGTYQFLPSTWESLARSHPELGLTADGMTDPGQQQKAIQAFTIDNAKALSGAGIAPNPGTLYAAHFLGAGGATKVLSSPDDAPVAALVPAAAAANPAIADMNVGQFKQWAAGQGSGASGGYSPPMGQGASMFNAQPVALPDRETMLALFRSAETRPLAMQMVAAYRNNQDPNAVLGLALKGAQLQQAELNLNGGAIPDGYRRSATGGLEAIPGGPDDPNNPLNAMKTGGFGQAMSGNAQVSTDNSGIPDPVQQQDFLKSLPPGTASLVKGVINYQLDPTKVSSMRGNQRQQLIQLAQEADPSFDMTQYGARAAMRKSITSGTYSQALNSANLVIQHLDALSKAADALHNQSFTPWNAVSNATKNVTGDPTITNFKVAADAAGSELAKVFKGSGASDVQSIQEWRNNLDANSSPEQIHQAIATAVGDLLKSRIDTIANQYHSAMGRPADFNFLTAHSRQVLSDLGIDPSSLDPESAAAGSTQPVADQSAPAQAGAPAAATQSASVAPQGGQTKTINGVAYTQDANGDWYQQ